jgi:multidrug efflux pump subunit AcrB
VAAVYLIAAGAVATLIVRNLGTDIFPQTDTGQIQMRLRAPTGTRVEKTERIVQDVLAEIGAQADILSSLAFVGVQPSAYPVNLIFLWTGGPHEAVMRIALKPGGKLSSADLQERLRKRVGQVAPGTSITFEAADLVSQVMSFGAPTPVEVAVTSPNLASTGNMPTRSSPGSPRSRPA